MYMLGSLLFLLRLILLLITVVMCVHAVAETFDRPGRSEALGWPLIAVVAAVAGAWQARTLMLESIAAGQAKDR